MIVGDMEIRLRADIARLQADMNQARRVVTETQDRINSAANAMKTALAGIGIGAGLAEIIKMADEYAKFTAQLRLASTSVADYAASYEAVKRIAKTSQQDLASTGVLYARIANGTRELGTTQKQVAAITETVNLALRVSGATATESASAQLQLSQAFASGTLRGEEFNAVNEAAPRLMKALADGMGLPVGALKAMAGEGLITSNIMATVLPKALESLREESKNIQTISGAFTVLKNEMLEFFGIQAQANGTVALITGAIRLLSENLGSLVIVLKTLMAYQIGTWVATWVTKTYQQVSASIALRAATVAQAEAEMARTTSLVAQSQAAIAGLAVTHEATLVRLRSANADRVAAQAAIAAASAAGAQSFALRTLRIATAELAVAETLRAAYLTGSAALDRAKVAAIGQLTAATAAQVAAQAALNGVTAAGITAAGVASKAIGFLGGPIGAIILLLGTAALAWEVFGKKAKVANEQAAESFEEAHARIIKALDTQIDKQQNLLQLKNLGLTNQQAEKELPIIKQLEAATKRMGELNARTGDFAGISNDDAIFKRIELNKQVNELIEKQAKATKGAADVAKVTGNEAYNEWKKTYATREEQRVAEIADLKSRNLNAEQYAEILGRINLKYADKDAAKSLKQEENAYKTLVASIQEKLEANKLEALGFESMTDAQKMTVKLNAAILADKTKLNAADIERVRVLIAQVAAEDAQLLSGKNVKKAIEELKDERDKDAASAFDEIEANKQAIATFGLTKAQIEALTLARMEDRMARRGPQDLDLDEAEVHHLARMIGLQKEKAATAATLGALDSGSDVTKAKELLDILTAVDNAAKDAASGMAASFGAVGSAIGGMTTALSGFSRDQAAIAAQLAASMKDAAGDPAKIAKAQAVAAQQGAQAQVRSYGDMASAAKGFFKEKSAGYKVMETAEKAFRAYEMAMAVESMIKKIFFKETEVAANLALNATKLTGEATTTAASTGLAATEASAWGITAVVKALASLPFPMNLAAGAATLAAVVAIGAKMFGGVGGGSVSLSERRQAANGTGTVLGDPTAKSESIAKSLSLIADNTFRDLAISSGMLSALRNIESGIGGLGGLLAQTPGVTNKVAGPENGAFANFNAQTLKTFPLTAIVDKLTGGFLTKISNSVTNAIFGGKVTTLDTGITAGKASLNQIDRSGLSVGQFTDIKKDGGLFRKDKYRSPVTPLGAEMDDQFTKIVLGLRDTVNAAADALGVGGDAFTAKLNSFVVDIGKISFKGLDAKAQQEALEAAFSKMGDDMAKFGVDGLRQFRAVGEGYLETLVRVANDYATIDAVLGSFNKTFGAVGISSIAAREELLKMSGGLDNFTSQGAFFLENFFTDKEKADTLRKSVNAILTPLNKGKDITSVEEFKKLALAQDLSTEAGQKTYTSMMAVSQAFIELTRYGDEFGVVAKTASEIDSERKDLQKQLNELTKSETELLAIQRSAIADVNKALFDQIQAAKAVITAKDALAKAYDTESAAAKTALEKSKAWVATLNGLNASMNLGNQSILTPEQKYAEARAQFEKTLAAANTGDTTAQSGLSAAEQAFLTASQVVNASDAKYAADYARVIAANQDAAKWAAAQVDVQQASLDALKAQVSGLITINDSVLTVAQAIANLHAAMGTATGLGVQFDGSHAGGLANVPFDGYAAELHRGEVVVDAQAASAMRRYFGGAPSQGGGNTDALVAEIKSLREEVKGLRADQDKQTGAAIQATVESNAVAAKTVVEGVDKSARAAARVKQVEYSK